MIYTIYVDCTSTRGKPHVLTSDLMDDRKYKNDLEVVIDVPGEIGLKYIPRKKLKYIKTIGLKLRNDR